MDENTLALETLALCLEQGISFLIGAFTAMAFTIASGIKL